MKVPRRFRKRLTWSTCYLRRREAVLSGVQWISWKWTRECLVTFLKNWLNDYYKLTGHSYSVKERSYSPSLSEEYGSIARVCHGLALSRRSGSSCSSYYRLLPSELSSPVWLGVSDGYEVVFETWSSSSRFFFLSYPTSSHRLQMTHKQSLLLGSLGPYRSTP